MHLERASSNVPEIAELDGDLKKNGPLAEPALIGQFGATRGRTEYFSADGTM